MKEVTIYYLKNNGNQVFLEDQISASMTTEDGITMSVNCIANEKTIPHLLDMKIIGKRKTIDIRCCTKEDVISKVIERISYRTAIPKARVAETLDNLVNINQMAVLNVFLKEIAILLDRTYSTHISESKDLYIISSVDGTICKVKKPLCNNYRGFAAFRTFEDAKFAVDILQEGFSKVFNCEEQEDKKCDCK